jgi:hypothetical protein
MKIEERPVVATAARPHPLAFDTTDSGGFSLEPIRRSWQHVSESVEKRSLLVDRLSLHVACSGEELCERCPILDCHCKAPKAEGGRQISETRVFAKRAHMVNPGRREPMFSDI